MPIDRHASGDDFDRSDDARVNESEQQQAEIRTTDARAKRAKKGAGKTDARTNARKAGAGKSAVSRTKAGRTNAGRKGTPPAGAARSAGATDTAATDEAKAVKAAKGSSAKKSTAKKSTAKTVARRTAKSRAGNTAQSKQTAMKAMARKELARKSLMQKALLERSLKDAAPAGGTVRDVAETKPEERAEKARRKAEQAGKAAGNGIIWSLLALGLAACSGGGGTNTLLRTRDVSGDPEVQTIPEINPEVIVQGAAGDGVAAAGFDVVRVIDGPIWRAAVWGYREGSDTPEFIGHTNERGELELTAGMRGQFVRFEARLKGATDVATGTTYEDDIILSSVAGSNLVSPLTTLIQEAIDDALGDEDEATTAETAQQHVIDILFGRNSGVTMDHIRNYVNYRVTEKANGNSTDAYAETGNLLGRMGIRVLETVRQKFLALKRANDALADDHDDKKTDAELYRDAVKDVAKDIGGATVNRDGSSNADNAGILAESDSNVQEMIENSEQFGAGRPFAAPNPISMREDGTPEGRIVTTTVPPVPENTTVPDDQPQPGSPVISEEEHDADAPEDENTDGIDDKAKPISLTDFGFVDANVGDVLGAITFTDIASLDGTLQFIAARAFTYHGAAVAKGDVVTIVADELVQTDWVEGGLFHFTPTPNWHGKTGFEFTLHDKKRGGEFDSQASKVSTPKTMNIEVSAVNDRPHNLTLSGRKHDDGAESQDSDGTAESEFNVVSGMDELKGGDLQNDRYVLVESQVKREVDGQVEDQVKGLLQTTDGDIVGEVDVTDQEDTDIGALTNLKHFQINGPDAAYFEMVRFQKTGQDTTSDTSDDTYGWRLEMKSTAALQEAGLTPKPEGALYHVTLLFVDSGGASASRSFEIVQGGMHLTSATPGMSDHGSRYYSGSERGALWEEYSPTQNVETDGGTTPGGDTMSYTGGAADDLVTSSSDAAGPDFAFAVTAVADAPVVGVTVVLAARPTVTLTLKAGTSAADLKAYLDKLFDTADQIVPVSDGSNDAAIAEANAINAARAELAKVMLLTTAITFAVEPGSDDDPGTTADAPAASTTDANSITLQLADSTVSTKDATDDSSGLNAGDLSAVETPRKKPASQWMAVEGGTIITDDGATTIEYEGNLLELFTDTNSDGSIDTNDQTETRPTTIYVSRDADGDWSAKAIATAHIGNAPGTQPDSGLQGVAHFVLATVAADGAVTRNAHGDQSWTIGDKTDKSFDSTGSVDQNTERGTVIKRDSAWELTPQSEENDNGNYSVSGNTLTRGNDTPVADADQADRPSETVELTRTTTETFLHQHNFQGFKGVQKDMQPTMVDDGSGNQIANTSDVNTDSFSFSARDGGDADNLVGTLTKERLSTTDVVLEALPDEVSHDTVASSSTNVAEDTPRRDAQVGAARMGDAEWGIGMRANVLAGHPTSGELFVLDLNFGGDTTTTYQNLDVFILKIATATGSHNIDYDAAKDAFVFTLPVGRGNRGDATFGHYRIVEAFRLDLEKGVESRILSNVDLRILLKPVADAALTGVKGQTSGNSRVDTGIAAHLDPVSNLASEDSTFTRLLSDYETTPNSQNRDALINHIAGNANLKAAVLAKLVLALTAAGGTQANRDDLGVDPLAGFYSIKDAAPTDLPTPTPFTVVQQEVTTVQAGTIYLTDGRHFGFDETKLTVFTDTDDDGVIDRVNDMVVVVEAPATYGDAGKGTVRILSQADFDAIADKSNLYVIAKIAAADGVVTHNAVGGEDVNAAENLVYTTTETVTKSFELKVKNVNDNGPEVTGVTGDGAGADAGTGAVGALNAETGQWDITLTEEVGSGPVRRDPRTNNDIDDQTVTVAAADADNIQGDNLRGPNSHMSADRDPSDTISYHGVAHAAANNNDRVDSVNAETGEITFKHGALNYENADLRVEEGTGRKFYLIQVEVRSATKLSDDGRDARGGTVDSVTRIIKLYVAPANDAPTDIQLIDDVAGNNPIFFLIGNGRFNPLNLYDFISGSPVVVGGGQDGIDKQTYDSLLVMSQSHEGLNLFGSAERLKQLHDSITAYLRDQNAERDEDGNFVAGPDGYFQVKGVGGEDDRPLLKGAVNPDAAPFAEALGEIARAFPGGHPDQLQLAAGNARLVVEAGYDGQDIAIGRIEVTDSDSAQGQSHRFEISSTLSGDLAALFTVRTDANGVHTLYYIGGVAGLPALQAFRGETFYLTITATDLDFANPAGPGTVSGGKQVTKVVAIAYEAVEITTPERGAVEDAEAPDVNIPAATPETLQSGRTKDQTADNVDGVSVTQTVGGVVEHVDGNTTPVVVGELTLAGVARELVKDAKVELPLRAEIQALKDAFALLTDDDDATDDGTAATDADNFAARLLNFSTLFSGVKVLASAAPGTVSAPVITTAQALIDALAAIQGGDAAKATAATGAGTGDQKDAFTTALNPYEVKWGTVDANGVFTAAPNQTNPGADSRLFLLFTGSDAGDYENPVLVLPDGTHIAARLVLELVVEKARAVPANTAHVDVQADGDDGNANSDEFSYAGGAVTVNTSTAANNGRLTGGLADIVIQTGTTAGVVFAQGLLGNRSVITVTITGTSIAVSDLIDMLVADAASDAISQALGGTEGDNEGARRATFQSTLATLGVDELSSNLFATQSGTDSQLAVTVGDVTLVTRDGELVELSGGPLQPSTADDNNPQFVYVAKNEDGAWTLMLGKRPDDGEFYVLSGPLTPGTTPGTTPDNPDGTPAAANSTGGDTASELTYEVKQRLDYDVPIRNIDDEEPAFPQGEAGNPNLASDAATFKKQPTGDDDVINNGEHSLTINGAEWTVTIRTGNAGVAMGDAAQDGPPVVPAVNSLTISLPAGSRTIADLVDLFEAAATESLSVAELARLGIFDETDSTVRPADAVIEAAIKSVLATANAKNAAGNDIIAVDGGDESAAPEDAATTPAPVGGSGKIQSDVSQHDSKDVVPEFEGEPWKGVSTGIIVGGARDADGDAVLYRLAAAAANNDNDLVTLALDADGRLVIVFREGGPDWEAVNTGGQKKANTGKYVFVVEAVTRSGLSDDPDEPSSRREEVASLQYDYVVEDADEAPWDIGFNTTDYSVAPRTVAGIDGGVFATIHFKNDAGDGGNSHADGNQGTAATAAAYEGVTIRIKSVTYTDASGVKHAVNWLDILGINPANGELSWKTGDARDITLADGSKVTMARGEQLAVEVEIADKTVNGQPVVNVEQAAGQQALATLKAAFGPFIGTVPELAAAFPDGIGELSAQEILAELTPALRAQLEAASPGTLQVLQNIAEQEVAPTPGLVATKTLTLVNGTVTIMTTDGANGGPDVKGAFATYDALDTVDQTDAAKETLYDEINKTDAAEADFSGVADVPEDSSGKTFIGFLKSTVEHSHFWLVNHGPTHINSRFEIEAFDLHDGTDAVTVYALFLKAGHDVRNLEAGYAHQLEIGSGSAAPTDVGASNAFTGQMFVDADGVAGGASFAYDASIMGTNTPAVTTDTALDTDEADGGTAANSTLTYSIMLSGGAVYHSTDGTVGERRSLTKGGALGSALITDPFEIKTPIIPDEDGEQVYVLVVRVLNGFGADRNGSPQFMTAEDWADATKADFVLLGTLTVTVSGANTADAVHTARWVANTGAAVEGGQRQHLPDDAEISTETYEVKPADANEAPEALRIIANDEDGTQVALDWANTAPDGSDVPSAVAFDLDGGAVDGNADNDRITGLKDGAIWTYDAAGVGTPIYFQAPVDGVLALGAGANTLYISQDADGIWRMKVTSNYAAVAGVDGTDKISLGTVSAPDSGNGNVRTFTPAAEVDRATAGESGAAPAALGDAVDNTKAGSGGNIAVSNAVILTSAHLRAEDEDGSDIDPADIVYILTAYQPSDYHQDDWRTPAADQDLEVMGWIEVWNTDTSQWVKQAPVAGPTGATPAHFTQKQVNDGHVRFVSSGADSTDPAQKGQPDFTAWFTYVVRDNKQDVEGTLQDESADRKVSPVKTATVKITDTPDAPFIDTDATDGNRAEKTADVAARTFNENVPQTAVNVARDNTSKQGGITLTNEMFGIVDVDTPDADIVVKMLASPGGVDIEAGVAYVAATGQVSVADGSGVLTPIGVIQKRIVNGDNPATEVVETDFTGWVNAQSFTLAELKAENVRFVQDVRSELRSIKLFIDQISDGSATPVSFDPGVAAQRAQALVELFVTPADDQLREFATTPAEAVTGAPDADAGLNTLQIAEGENEVVSNRLITLGDLNFEDYDLASNLGLRISNINVDNLSFGGDVHVTMQKLVTMLNPNAGQPGEPPTIEVWQNFGTPDGWTGFTLQEVEEGKVRLLHSGLNPVDGTGVFLSNQTFSFSYDVSSAVLRDADAGLKNRDGGGPGNLAFTKAGNTFSVTVNAVNDQPTDIQVSTSRIDTRAAGGDVVATFTATDEESSVLADGARVPGDNSNFTYELVETGDYLYFSIDNNGQLSFRPEEALADLNPPLLLKELGGRYSITVKVTDNGVGDDSSSDGRAPESFTETFSFEVRDLDIDWDDDNTDDYGTDPGTRDNLLVESKEIEVDVSSNNGTEDGATVVTSLTILPRRGYDPAGAQQLVNQVVGDRFVAAPFGQNGLTDNNFRIVAGDVDVVGGVVRFGDDLGTYTVTRGTHANDFVIRFTATRKALNLVRLTENEKTLKQDYSFVIEYQDPVRDKGEIVIKQATVTFKVTFVGKHDLPEFSADPVEYDAFVADIERFDRGKDGQTDTDRAKLPTETQDDVVIRGTWGVTDRDAGAYWTSMTLSATYQVNGEERTPSANVRNPNEAAGTNYGDRGDGFLSLEGKYGTITLFADGTYIYIADHKKLTQVQLVGETRGGREISPTTDDFTFTVTDNAGKTSAAFTLKVDVRGQKDAPHLALRVDDGQRDYEGAYDGFFTDDEITAARSATQADRQVYSPRFVEDTPGSDFDPAQPDSRTGAGAWTATPAITGHWMAIDPDNNAELVVLLDGKDPQKLTTGRRDDQPTSGSYGGTKLTGSNAIVLTGKYGDLTLNSDGTWSYQLDTARDGSGRGDKIAHSQNVDDEFKLTVRDGSKEISNEVVLRIQLEGRNDRPTGLQASVEWPDLMDAGGASRLLDIVTASDGTVVITGGTPDNNEDDITIESNGNIVLQGGKVQFGGPSATQDQNYVESLFDGAISIVGIPQGAGVVSASRTANSSGDLVLTVGTGPQQFVVTRFADGRVEVTYTKGGKQQTLLLRGTDADIGADTDNPDNENSPHESVDSNDVGLLLGNLVEAGDRWNDDGVTLERNSDGGIAMLRGTFDATDPDSLGASGRANSRDDHTYVLKAIGDANGGNAHLDNLQKFIGIVQAIINVADVGADAAARQAAFHRKQVIDQLIGDAAEDNPNGAGTAFDAVDYLSLLALAKTALGQNGGDDTRADAIEAQVNAMLAASGGGQANDFQTALTVLKTALATLIAALAPAELAGTGLAAAPGGTAPDPDRPNDRAASDGNKIEQENNNGDAKTTVNGVYGTLSVNKFTGQFKYLLQNDWAATQTLAQGQVVFDKFILVSTDQHGSKIETLVRVRITGTGDAPTIDLGTAVLDPKENGYSGPAGSEDVLELTAADRALAAEEYRAFVREAGEPATRGNGDDNKTTPQPQFIGGANGVIGERNAWTSGTSQSFIITDSDQDFVAARVDGANNAIFARHMSRGSEADPQPARATEYGGDGGFTQIDTSRIVAGAYGDLKGFNPNGTEGWRYELHQGRADSLNEGEVQYDYFELYITDADGLNSNRVVLKIKVTGTNDQANVVAHTVTNDIDMAADEAGHVTADTDTLANNRAVSQDTDDSTTMPDDVSFGGGPADAHGYFVPTDKDAMDDTANLGLRGWVATADSHGDVDIRREMSEAMKAFLALDMTTVTDDEYNTAHDALSDIGAEGAFKTEVNLIFSLAGVPNVFTPEEARSLAQNTILNQLAIFDRTKTFREALNDGADVMRFIQAWDVLKAAQNDANLAAFRAAMNALPEGGLAGGGLAGGIRAAANALSAIFGTDPFSPVIWGAQEALRTAIDNAITAYRNGNDAATGDGLRLAGKFGVLVLEWDSGYEGADATDGPGRWKWTYHLANAVDEDTGRTQAMVDALNILDKDDTVDEVFTFIITDSSGVERTDSFTITITGSNDRPVINGHVNGAVNSNEGGSNLAGALSEAVTDNTGTTTPAIGANTVMGRINFTDDDAEHDAVGGKATFAYLLKSLLTTATSLTSGTNEVTAATVANVRANDDDTGFAVTSVDGVYGTITVTPGTGVWTYVLNDAATHVQALDQGDTAYDKFAVRVRDALGAVSATDYITVTINGSNDAPTAAALPADGQGAGNDANLAASVAEAGGADNGTRDQGGVTAGSASGHIAVNDVDDEDRPIDLGLKVEHLSEAVGDTNADVFTATGPDVAAAGAGNDRAAHDTHVIEGTYGYFVLTWVADINGATDGTPMGWKWDYHLADTIDPASLPAGITAGHLGNLDELQNALKLLDEGERNVEKFKLTFTDSRNAEVSKTVEVTVTGANDQSAITVNKFRSDASFAGGQGLQDGSGSGSSNGLGQQRNADRDLVSADGAANNTTAYGYLIATDDDDGDTSASLGMTGWSTTAGVPSTANNTNNRQMLRPADGAVVTDAADLRIAGKFGVMVMTWDGAHAEADATDGPGRWTWIYHLATDVNADLGITQAMVREVKLLDAEMAEEVFSFQSTDGLIASEVQTVTIRVQGVNDVPVIFAVTDGTGDEGADDAVASHITGTISVEDPDDDDDPSDVAAGGLYGGRFNVKLSWVTATGGAGTIASTTGDHAAAVFGTAAATGSVPTGVHAGKRANMTYNEWNLTHGTLYVYADGSYTFVINDSHAEVNGLDAGQSIVKTVSVIVNDGEGDSAPQDLVITINGVDDAPVAVDQSETVNEDTGLTFAAADFTTGFSDAEGHAITHVVISELPLNGTLQLNNADVTLNQAIAIGDIDNLVFRAAEHENNDTDGTTDHYTTFGFRLRANGRDSDQQTMTVNVTPVEDAATLSAGASRITNTPARDQNEVLALFDITDVDTDFTAAGNAGLITRSGTDAARFIHSVARKQGAGNENTYVVTVTWAAGQKPEYDTGVGADNQYDLTLQIVTRRQDGTDETQNATLQVNVDNRPVFAFGTPTTLTVNENATVNIEIHDFNARSATSDAGTQDAAGGVTYSLKGGDAVNGFLTDAQVAQYLQIDAGGRVTLRAALPNQDAQGALSGGKFYVTATDRGDGTKTRDHEVELTINNVLDEDPTFTLPTGQTALTAREGTSSLNGTTTPTVRNNDTSGSLPAIEYRKAPGDLNDWIIVDSSTGEISVTGGMTIPNTVSTKAANNTVRVGIQWKFETETDWNDAGNAEITVENVLQFPTTTSFTMPARIAVFGASGSVFSLPWSVFTDHVQWNDFAELEAQLNYVRFTVADFSRGQSTRSGGFDHEGFHIRNGSIVAREEFADTTKQWVSTFGTVPSAGQVMLSVNGVDFFPLDGTPPTADQLGLTWGGDNDTRETMIGDDQRNWFRPDTNYGELEQADVIVGLNRDTQNDVIVLGSLDGFTNNTIYYKRENALNNDDALETVLYADAAGRQAAVVIIDDPAFTPDNAAFQENLASWTFAEIV